MAETITKPNHARLACDARDASGFRRDRWLRVLHRIRTTASIGDSPNERVFLFEEDDVAEFHVTTEAGEVTALKRTNDGNAWEITEPIRTSADEIATSSIVRSLATLEVQRVVEEEART